MLKISDRLSKVAELVPQDARLIDVGTDHGYVPIWLLQKGRIRSALAMDINRGPLMRAEENRERYGFSDKIKTRLSNGLEKLEKNEGDTVLIAGMGGPLIIRIMEESKEKHGDISTWILQPQSEIPMVRKYLIQQGFEILEEIMLKEDGKYYMAMKAIPNKSGSWSELEYLFGKYLLKGKHPVLYEYICKEEILYKKIHDQLIKSGQDDSERFKEVTDYLKALEEAKMQF